MAGAILERELSRTRADGIQFDLARRADDSEIRRLLRENPMPGRISISLEREPDFFADADLPGEFKQNIVARERGPVVCVGSCTFRPRYVNGRPLRVGYLGGLRLDGHWAGRFDILRRGYEFFRDLQAGTPAPFYFTSVAADNERARRFLERGLPGLPIYEPIGEFVTLLIPTCRSGNPQAAEWKIDRGFPDSFPAQQLIDFVNERNRLCQFAPCWTADEWTSLKQLGLQESDFCILSKGGRTAGCGALWDQRRFKQTVIRKYAPSLAFARPVLNAFARTMGQPRLPAVGEGLANAFACHIATHPNEPTVLVSLMKQLRAMANQRGIELLTLGFALNHPGLATVRDNFRCREYRSRLYLVRWPGIGGSAGELDGRILAPEVALL